MVKYENLSYEEKKELLRLLECDGIRINKKNFSDKRKVFDSLWGNSICIEPLRKSILELADVLSTNFEEKVRSYNHREIRSYTRRSTIPEDIKDEYVKITKSLIEAVMPYSDKATENWRGYWESVETAKCKDCVYRILISGRLRCGNENSCYYASAIEDNFACAHFNNKDEPNKSKIKEE